MRRLFLITNFGPVEITNEKHILRNLNWADPRLLWIYPGETLVFGG